MTKPPDPEPVVGAPQDLKDLPTIIAEIRLEAENALDTAKMHGRGTPEHDAAMELVVTCLRHANKLAALSAPPVPQEPLVRVGPKTCHDCGFPLIWTAIWQGWACIICLHNDFYGAAPPVPVGGSRPKDDDD